MAHSDYLEPLFDKEMRDKTVASVCKIVEQLDCDAIAFTGMSGALIAPIIAHVTGKNLLLIRKKTDNTHSTYNVEASSKECEKYVIIDDFICSGKTIDSIIERMESDDLFEDAVCTGIVLYNSDNYIKSHNNGNQVIPVYTFKIPQ